MKVTLIKYFEGAQELLLFTKLTRLRMSPAGMDEVMAMSPEEKAAHWRHMQHTIKSSWEFSEYVFVIEGVTRAFTHQLVRHRIGTSFAQQSQRAVDMSEFEAVPGPSIAREGQQHNWANALDDIKVAYRDLLSAGVDAQDARGLLPTNVVTNIVFKANLRTLHGMISERLCVRAQGEFQDVCLQMREEVIAVHPWAEPVLRVHCAQTGTCLFEDLPVDQCAVKPGTLNMATGEAYEGEAVRSREDLWATWQASRRSVQPPVAR